MAAPARQRDETGLVGITHSWLDQATIKAQSRHNRTAAKTREDIISVGSEEVSVARMAHPRMRGERSSAQHLAGAEPGQRVVAVRMRRKTRVGLEGRVSP